VRTALGVLEVIGNARLDGDYREAVVARLRELA
jgi:hypothetical protein